VAVPDGSKRLLAFVALHHDRVERRHAAGALWPIGDDMHAAASLRSTLWRLNRACVPLIAADRRSLRLRAEVVTDLAIAGRWAKRIIDGSARAADLEIKPWGIGALDLLPGWYDDWALMERERIRERLLHALEALSSVLVRSRRYEEAIEAALFAVGTDPLRDSAQKKLIEAYLAEGNWIEARRRFEAYRQLLRREMRTEPAPLLFEMLHRSSSSNLHHNSLHGPALPKDQLTRRPALSNVRWCDDEVPRQQKRQQ
jgi:DNA-binding SARP family transcriptional activator